MLKKRRSQRLAVPRDVTNTILDSSMLLLSQDVVGDLTQMLNELNKNIENKINCCSFDCLFPLILISFLSWPFFNTVLSPISGHLWLADIFFRRLFSCQSFIENFLKAGHLISGQNFYTKWQFQPVSLFKCFQVIYLNHFDTLRSERTIGNRPNQQ